MWALLMPMEFVHNIARHGLSTLDIPRQVRICASKIDQIPNQAIADAKIIPQQNRLEHADSFHFDEMNHQQVTPY